MAFDSKKALESRLETLQAYYSNLEGEVSRLKGELRVSRIQLKKFQQKEKLMSTLQAGYEEEKGGLIKEQQELKTMLDSTRDQLRREGEVKLQAQFTAAKAREGTHYTMPHTIPCHTLYHATHYTMPHTVPCHTLYHTTPGVGTHI